MTRTRQGGELVAALEEVWTAIRRRHPEVPEAVLVVGPGSDARRAELVRLGHFAAERWHNPDGGLLPEVFVGGEGLAREAPAIFATLLHEAAHALARARGIKDTSRQGRYHNGRFKQIAEELGLEVERDQERGFARTTLSGGARKRFGAAIARLDAAVGSYRDLERTDRRGSAARGRLACVCACPRRIWVSPTVLTAGPINCQLCRERFTPASAP